MNIKQNAVNALDLGHAWEAFEYKYWRISECVLLCFLFVKCKREKKC